MIFEGSCDTEDWSNDAENSAFITEINYSLKYMQIEKVISDLFQKHEKSCRPQTFEGQCTQSDK